jgi:shikimate dehydrogenase
MSRAGKACVIGWPIEHSRSPLIHGFWLERHGIEGAYEKVAVAPEDLKDFLASLEAKGFRGANVTVPHKEAALALADEADETARAIGAANTLWLKDGRLMASNTDAYGFVTHLDDIVPGWHDAGHPACVLGAGGATRAVLKGLIDRGVSDIRLTNRTRERAEALAREFGPAITVHDWDDRDRALKGCGLLVNTTSLGMTGAPPLELDLSALRDDAIVADIVYAPLETDLLARARERGLRAVDGLGMLLHQAVPGFEKWFGVRPEVTEDLRSRIVADLEDS